MKWITKEVYEYNVVERHCDIDRLHRLAQINYRQPDIERLMEWVLTEAGLPMPALTFRGRGFGRGWYEWPIPGTHYGRINLDPIAPLLTVAHELAHHSTYWLIDQRTGHNVDWAIQYDKMAKLVEYFRIYKEV